jgi:CBS domain-containing protein
MALGGCTGDPDRVTDTSPTHLDSARVGDCMRAGIFTCEPDTSARELAAMMSSLRIHAVAVRAGTGQAPALIDDLDVIAGLAKGGDPQAHQLGPGTALTIPRSQSLRDAAKLMAAHRAEHLVVVDQASGHAVGVLSTTDILQVYAASAPVDAKE